MCSHLTLCIRLHVLGVVVGFALPLMCLSYRMATQHYTMHPKVATQMWSIYCVTKERMSTRYTACSTNVSMQRSTTSQATMWIASSFLKMIDDSTVFTLQGNQPPLYTASLRGNLTIVKILVSRGARIDQPTDVRLFVCMLIIVL